MGGVSERLGERGKRERQGERGEKREGWGEAGGESGL